MAHIGHRCCLLALGLWSAALAGPASAAEPQAPSPAPSAAGALTLEEVLAATERSYPALRAAELERRIASAELESANGGFDVALKARGTVTPLGYYDSVRAEALIEQPTPWWGASGFVRYKLGTGEFPVYEGQHQTLEYGEVRAGVQLPLWRNRAIDRRRANIERAELGVELSELSVAQQRIELRRVASQRYWGWVAAGQRVVVARALLDNLMARDVAIAQRVDAGELAPIERVENRRAMEQRRALLVQAQRGLEQAAIELGLFLRDSAGEPTQPKPDRLPAAFPAVPGATASSVSQDGELAREQRPEARALELQGEQQRIELEWAQNQLAPSIDLQVGVARDFGSELASRPDLSETVVEASVLVEIPFQTRLLRGRVDAARAAVERLDARTKLARDRIDADVRDAHSALAAARERIEATRREVALALELEAGENARFAQGDSNLLIVNLREQQTAEARLREVDALLDYFRAEADLRAARGS